VIPTIITQALTQTEIRLGNLDARRDLTFVSDTVAAFICAAEIAGIEGETLNLGTGTEIRISDLAQKIIALVGKPVQIAIDSARLRPEKSEVQRLLADNRCAQERLGWKPVVSLDAGLQQTIAWIADHLDLYGPTQYQV